MASGPLSLLLNYSMNVGKEKMAAKANESALSMIQANNYGNTDPRTVLNTAYSTGVMLGTIKEDVKFDDWAKKTLDSQTIPEVNKNLINQGRAINKSAGFGWAAGMAGEELYNNLLLYKQYTQNPSAGLATTTKNGLVVGMIGSAGGGQAGMLADADGKAIRDADGAVIRVDADGKAYTYTGFFNSKKKYITDKNAIKGAVDPQKDNSGNDGGNAARVAAQKIIDDAEKARLAKLAIAPTAAESETVRVAGGAGGKNTGEGGIGSNLSATGQGQAPGGGQDLLSTGGSGSTAGQMTTPQFTMSDLNNDKMEERNQPGGDLYKAAAAESVKAAMDRPDIASEVSSDVFEEAEETRDTSYDDNLFYNKGGLVSRPKKKKK